MAAHRNHSSAMKPTGTASCCWLGGSSCHPATMSGCVGRAAASVVRVVAVMHAAPVPKKSPHAPPVNAPKIGTGNSSPPFLEPCAEPPVESVGKPVKGAYVASSPRRLQGPKRPEKRPPSGQISFRIRVEEYDWLNTNNISSIRSFY